MKFNQAEVIDMFWDPFDEFERIVFAILFNKELKTVNFISQ